MSDQPWTADGADVCPRCDSELAQVQTKNGRRLEVILLDVQLEIVSEAGYQVRGNLVHTHHNCEATRLGRAAAFDEGIRHVG